MKNKKWELRALENKIDPMSFNLLNLAQMVLIARGVEDREHAEEFLRTDLSMLYDPFLMPDMDKAVKEIHEAIAKKQKIAVYGDYDVDGVTSTCILIKYLKSKNIECEYYIPDRIIEGYGLNIHAIDALYKNGVNLLITVDSGITAIEETKYAQSLGMKVVITDHHECKETIPNAEAVVNPRRFDSQYPFKELAGVGVAFKLICALEKENYSIEELICMYGDIVAIGTVADVMPLVSENRAIVYNGLKVLERTRNKGLYALMKKLNLLGKCITATNVSFMMAPRINAAGRLGGAANAAKMILTQKEDEAMEIAELLCDMNAQRQAAENDIYQEILAKIEIEYDKEKDKAIVLWGENWHNGVIGIVASRLAEKYFVPTVLISLDKENGKGSGRSIKGLNLYQGLEKCGHLLEKYGGHEMAVGLTIDRENLVQFRTDLNQYCSEIMDIEEIVPTITVDCELSPKMLSLCQVQGLQKLEPFGMSNPQPVFVVRDMQIDELTPIGKDKHVKLKVSKGECRFDALGFGLPTIGCQFTCGDKVDIVCTTDINEFRDEKNVQLIIKDIKFNENEVYNDNNYLKLYEKYKSGIDITPDEAKELLPSREDVISIFRHLKCKMYKKQVDLSVKYRKVRYEAKNNMNLARFIVSLDAMAEFGIVTYERENEIASIQLHDIGRKVDITQSKALKQLNILSRS